MQLKTYRYAWFLVILLATTLACQLVSDLGKTREKVGAIATEAKEGANMLGTARALVTQVGSSQMLKTAQALATEVGESGLLQTAIAVATEEGPSAIETARAFATREGPSLEETARAFATQEGPELQETAQAALTQISGSTGEPPADIPIIEGEKENLLTGELLVSFSVATSLKDVASFYKSAMPANGWTLDEHNMLETENFVALNYAKGSRKAAVTIEINPINQKTLVIILISGQ
jgi:hypothetical protein